MSDCKKDGRKEEEWLNVERKGRRTGTKDRYGQINLGVHKRRRERLKDECTWKAENVRNIDECRKGGRTERKGREWHNNLGMDKCKS